LRTEQRYAWVRGSYARLDRIEGNDRTNWGVKLSRDWPYRSVFPGDACRGTQRVVAIVGSRRHHVWGVVFSRDDL
jgi:hypothetical protein